MELRAFLDAVAYGADVAVTALDGLRAVAIAEAALTSVKTGKSISPSRA
jgi:predicted dehydrogenase